MKTTDTKPSATPPTATPPPAGSVSRITWHEDRVAFRKQPERRSLWMRLLKGDSAASLRRERDGLEQLGRLGLPVVPLLDVGPDYIVLADGGRTLRTVLADAGTKPTERHAALRAAGQALADLHRAGYTHGRPALRDMVWDGAKIRFIDLERFRPGTSSTTRIALDVILLTHNFRRLQPTTTADLEICMAGYRAAMPAAQIARIAAIARRLRAVVPLTWLIGHGRRKPNDMSSVGPALAYVARLDAPLSGEAAGPPV